MPTPATPPLVLASTSPFRRELLSRLIADFQVADPRTDETPLPDETPEALAQQWRNEFTESQPVWKSLLRGKKLDFEHVAFRAFVMERLSLPTLEEFLEQENLQLSSDDRALWNAA